MDCHGERPRTHSLLERIRYWSSTGRQRGREIASVVEHIGDPRGRSTMRREIFKKNAKD